MSSCYTIESWPVCGVGNRLLYYWNLRQKAHSEGKNWCVYPSSDVASLIDIDNSSSCTFSDSTQLPFCLGENFFKYTQDRLPIYSIFSLKEEREVPKTPYHKVCIHLRGGDFRTWKNGEGMLSLKYYTDAFDYFMDQVKYCSWPYQIEIICDDPEHPVLNPLQSHIYLQSGNGRALCRYERNSIAHDWYSMVESEWIISSPSTFAITAGMVSSAKIIHSKDWVEKRVSEEDPFWVGLDNGGNHEYSAEVFI